MEAADALAEQAETIERLRKALEEYGQHQRPACRELPATETQFCYCGLTAALRSAADPKPNRQRVAKYEG